jgi:tRNA A37 methylthiotransferase MiaB
MVTLGCDKNTVDSERILSGLVGAGVELAASPEDADVVVVNTCGFIEMAKQESIDTLLEAARLKESGRVRAVVGMGCLVQRYKPELEREMPEVDLFLGLTEADRLVPELARRGLMPDGRAPHGAAAPGPGRRRRPRHSAHLKISEGCDHTCAFCAIPLMRGKFRSTPMDLLVREARELERRGVVELNVVSQDTTWYGRDWARAMARAHRTSAPSPASNSEELLPRPPVRGHAEPGVDGRPAAGHGPSGPTGGVAESGGPDDGLPPARPGSAGRARCPSSWRPAGRDVHPLAPPLLHVPVGDHAGAGGAHRPGGPDRALPGHADPARVGPVLKRMRRPERRATILERVRWLRTPVPDLALRTTVIVGFPGETEDDFESLLELLDEVGFDHLGAFAYSEEEDTPAATMDGAVPEPVRRERLERLLDHQRMPSPGAERGPHRAPDARSWWTRWR